MPPVQMNVRIDSKLKQRGDAVFAKAGYTPSQVVRAAWEYAALHGAVPPFMSEQKDREHDEEIERRQALARQGAGLALKIAQEECGLALAADRETEPFDWRKERDAMYDEMIEDMDRRCGRA